MKYFVMTLVLAVAACLAPEDFNPGRFAVSPPWVAVVPGDSFQLTAGLANASGQIIRLSGVTWRTSDSTIASVDSGGMIRAYTVGIATVKASLADSVQHLTVAVAPSVLVGAGDVASCDSKGDEATAAILDTVHGIVIAPGDLAYERGSDNDFAQCYHPSWGRHQARTRPAPGNHEYYTSEARPYYDYFGPNAGNPGEGYYSYDLADWHVVVLNSSGRESPQLEWLRTDLAANRARCTVAYWHFPLFSSGPNGPYAQMRKFWQALYDLDVDIVINGHDHIYERFAPQDPYGNPDSIRGIRQFTVGTGGRSLYPMSSSRMRNSEVTNSTAYGVLKLTLHALNYDWVFIPATPGTFHDSGTGRCH